MNVKPLADRVIVETEESEEKTQSGIYLPELAREKPVYGKVLATGPGHRSKDGTLIPLEVNEGDRIIFAKYCGVEIEIDGEWVLILREADILARA